MSIHLADNTTQDMVTWSCRFIYPFRRKSHDHVNSAVRSGQSHIIMSVHRPLRTKSHDHVSSDGHSGQSHMIILFHLSIQDSHMIMSAHLSAQDMALHVHVCSSVTEYHSGYGRYMFMSARLSGNSTQDMAVTCLCQLICQGIPLRIWPLHVHAARLSRNMLGYH